jgi:hypothetical protein
MRAATCQILALSNFDVPAANQLQLSNFIAAANSSYKVGLVKFLYSSCKFEKAGNSCYNIYTKDEERKSYKTLSEILGVENLKNLQFSAIIYIQGERKVTHQEIQKLIGS